MRYFRKFIKPILFSVNNVAFIENQIYNFIFIKMALWGAWLAQEIECATPDLRVVN